MRIYIWMIVTIISRIIPHPANFTAMTSLSIFTGSQSTRLKATLVTLITLLCSDIIIALIYHNAIFGSWTLFSYSGFLVISFFSKFKMIKPFRKYKRLILFAITASLFYWVWTNFGSWLFSGMYAKNSQGLLSCYIAALPFLRNALLANALFTSLLWLLYSPSKTGMLALITKPSNQ